MEKKCKNCNTIKPFSKFYRCTGRNKNYSQSKAGYQVVCIECTLANKKEKYNSNPDKYRKDHRASNLRFSYGLSVSDWDKMFSDQNGCCAICETHQSDLKITLAVDHCHETGLVRKLLCTKCNLLIGNSYERVDILKKAIDYLNTYSELAAKSNVVPIKAPEKVG